MIEEGSLIARIIFNNDVVVCEGDKLNINFRINKDNIGKTINTKYGDVWIQLGFPFEIMRGVL